MRNPYDPSADELRAWAYTPGAVEPEQDWDLILSHGSYRALFFEFAADRSCPARAYFLQVLYLTAGDLFRAVTRAPEMRRAELQALAQQARNTRDYHLVTLAERIEALLAGRAPLQLRFVVRWGLRSRTPGLTRRLSERLLASTPRAQSASVLASSRRSACNR